MQENKVHDFIVVAIWNIPNLRHMDLYPNKPYQLLSKETQEKIQVEVKKSQFPFDDKTFDVVGSFYSVEHIHDIDFFAKELQRILKDDGIGSKAITFELLFSKIYFEYSPIFAPTSIKTVFIGKLLLIKFKI